MLNTEDEARRLVKDDWSSWSARGVVRKAFRNMPLTPEEEVPRHRSSRKRKPKHVHKWGEWIKIGEEVRRSWKRPRRDYFTVVKWVRTCKKCGHRDKGESTIGGEVKSGRYYYYW